MKNKGLLESEEAISAIISAVLLLGILVGILAIINATQIPAWKKDVEAAHMREIFNDFAFLKSNIEKLIALASSNSSSITSSTPIKLGGGELPVISPEKSSGLLEINSSAGSLVIIRNTTIAPFNITYTSAVNNDFPPPLENVTELKELKISPTYMMGPGTPSFNLSVRGGLSHDVIFTYVSGTSGLSILVDGTTVFYSSNYFSGAGNAYSPLTFDILTWLPGIRNPSKPINLSFNLVGGNSMITTSINGNNITANFSTVYDLNLTQLGHVRYSSRNNFWIDQSYIYENGGLILSQDNRSTMRLSPLITISPYATNDTTNISIIVHPIVITGASRSIGGTGIEEIKASTNSSANENIITTGYLNANSVTLIINTQYTQAWEQYLSTQAKNANLTSPDQFKTQITGNQVTLWINGTYYAPDNKNLDIQLQIIKSTVEMKIGSL